MNYDVALNGRNFPAKVNRADLNISGLTSQFGAWTKAYNHDKTETDPSAAFPGITYLFEYFFPVTFNAIHMSLIPKGPNRGKLVVWDNAPVLAVWPTIHATDLWSFQAWAIVDPADEPAGARFSNHLFPVGIVEGSLGTPATIRIPNLFCAGHAWTPNGDLLIAGGMRWDLAVNQYADNKVFIWAPSLAMTVHLTNDAGVTDRDLTLTGGHYTAQKGAWLQAKSLSSVGSVDGRYYPGVDMTPTLGRTSKVHALITGGSDDLLLANQTFANNSTWNTYESYVIDAAPTTTTSGLVKDDIAGTDVWNGPMNVGANEPFMDSLYFYPRMFTLTAGDMFMAGMVPQSATLTDHSGGPGSWSTARGHTLGITGNLDEFRYYGSAVHLQNFDGSADVIYRMGGAQIPPFIDWTAGVDPDREFDTNSVEVIRPTNGGTEQWAPAPDMRLPRQFLNTIVLPDASILALGGMDWQPETEPPVPHEFLVHGSGHLEEDFSYHTAAEILMPGATKWVAIDWNRALSVRGYHNTAVLLPDGRVFCGGGEGRRHDGGYDYEIFEPHYLLPQNGSPYRPTRPTNLAVEVVSSGLPASEDAEGTLLLAYGTQYEVTCDALPQYRKLTMAALTPCGSVTHHYSNSSRHRTLAVTEVDSVTLRFTTPASEQAWQKGYHLLWILTDQGVPAEALWVKFT